MVRLIEKRTGDLDKRAGILITDGKGVLGCLPTPTVKYLNLERQLDLPKGHMQIGETPVQAAIREVWEETNIKVEERILTYIGEFSLYEEPFYLFRAVIPQFPDTRQLSCPSTFYKGRIKAPENCAYEIVAYSCIEKRFFPELVPCIKAALGNG